MKLRDPVRATPPLPCFLIAVFALFAGDAGALEPRELRFDVYAFSQEDGGGQEFKAEGFAYLGVRSAGTVAVSSGTAAHWSAALALIDNDEPERLPATASSATVTSASARVLTLDFSATLEFRKPGSPWAVLPGIYFHQQKGYISEGFDLAVERELNGGDTVLSGSFHVRAAWLDLRFWDFREEPRDLALSNSFSLGVKQNLSPSVVGSLGFQFTRQDGVLFDTFNYVLLYNSAGTAYAVRDESLPNERHRGQASGRLRYSPRLGTALGADVSYYLDDWGIRHYAAEPSVRVPLPAGGHIRAWYRFSDQRESKYFDTAPRAPEIYLTQDSDLGGFLMHSGGVSFGFPFSSGAQPWEWRAAAFGFRRDDDISAVALDAGVVRKW